MTDLDLSALPDLPQCPLLSDLVRDLWADPAVSAVWLGGSLARGDGDAFSDVDLRVALAPPAEVSEVMPDAAHILTGRMTYNLTRRIGGDAVLHHLLLNDGQIYDLWVQTTDRRGRPERTVRTR